MRKLLLVVLILIVLLSGCLQDAPDDPPAPGPEQHFEPGPPIAARTPEDPGPTSPSRYEAHLDATDVLLEATNPTPESIRMRVRFEDMQRDAYWTLYGFRVANESGFTTSQELTGSPLPSSPLAQVASAPTGYRPFGPTYTDDLAPLFGMKFGDVTWEFDLEPGVNRVLVWLEHVAGNVTLEPAENKTPEIGIIGTDPLYFQVGMTFQEGDWDESTHVTTWAGGVVTAKKHVTLRYGGSSIFVHPLASVTATEITIGAAHIECHRGADDGPSTLAIGEATPGDYSIEGTAAAAHGEAALVYWVSDYPHDPKDPWLLHRPDNVCY